MTRTPHPSVGERPAAPVHELTVELPPTPDSGRLAREAVTGLDPFLHPEALAKVRLLVTELVVAALGPAQTRPLRLDVTVADGVVRAQLGPAATGSHFARSARPRSWGLFLVNRIADRWEAAADGVWFELDVS